MEENQFNYQQDGNWNNSISLIIQMLRALNLFYHQFKEEGAQVDKIYLSNILLHKGLDLEQVLVVLSNFQLFLNLQTKSVHQLGDKVVLECYRNLKLR